MLIGPLAAAAEAGRILDRLRTEGHPGIATVFTDGHAGVPVLVTCIGAQACDYYLVPWQDEHGIEVIVRIDAQSGELRSVVTLPVPQARLMPSPEEASRIASISLNVRVVGEPAVVWMPCRESASPFQPLYRVPVEGGIVFVGVDGSSYRSLTPFGQGG